MIFRPPGKSSGETLNYCKTKQKPSAEEIYSYRMFFPQHLLSKTSVGYNGDVLKTQIYAYPVLCSETRSSYFLRQRQKESTRVCITVTSGYSCTPVDINNI